jgi:hypothetical protein
MKNITLLLFLVIILNKTYSQITYFHYLDYTSEWRYYGAGWNGVNGYDSYETRYFDGDETINGTTYYKEYSKSVVTNYNPPFGSTYSTNYFGGPYYVREDSSGKFYRINPNDGTETVIFDNQEILNAFIGTPFPYPGAVCSVESIEVNYLGSIPLKRIKGNVTGSTAGSLEGIGVIGSNCAIGIEGNGWLNCYSKQNENIQFGTVSCNSFPVPVRVNLSTNTNNIAIDKISIYPNPTNGIINIKFNFQEICNYQLYNIYGRTIKIGNIENEKQTIDISNFAKGIYVLKIEVGNVIKYEKIIKE